MAKSNEESMAKGTPILLKVLKVLFVLFRLHKEKMTIHQTSSNFIKLHRTSPSFKTLWLPIAIARLPQEVQQQYIEADQGLVP